MPKVGIENTRDWIQEKAEEIAMEEHNKDFYNLSDELQEEVYKKAEEEYEQEVADNAESRLDELKY